MTTQLETKDTFQEWLTKLNDFISAYDTFIINEFTPGKFGYDPNQSSGLDVYITGGSVRDGNTIESIAAGTVTLTASSINYVCIDKRSGDTPSISVYTVLPEKYVIPVAKFVTSTAAVSSYDDLRTDFISGPGTDSSVSGVLQLDKIIDKDVTIPATKNALSVDPTVDTGVTVTVDPDSVWVVL